MNGNNPTILLVYHDCDLVLYKAFDALAARGQMNVVIAAPGNTNLPDTKHLKRIATEEIKSKFSLKARKALRHNIRQTGADIVFCVSTSALANALAAARGTGAKVVGYRGTQARVHKFDPTYRMALLNRRVAAIVCETEDICDYLGRYIPQEKLGWKRKPYMRAWIEREISDPEKPEGDGLQLSYVGMTQGRPHKGLRYLIEAMKMLDERGIKAHLTVVGSVDEADKEAAGENVTFAGKRSDAVRYIAAADVFVLPSLRDASPRVVREAQACGVPCVVSDIAGARDLIIAAGADRTGTLVKAADATAIADAVAELAKDEKLRKQMGMNGIRNIADHYDLDDYVDYLEKVFKPLIG
ncbi:MAG: glycosyltransferase family 4 protein [Bacteroidales bacterium]|nr:glycosyltransferase family 4 protein [Bacteroidales bacterium]